MANTTNLDLVPLDGDTTLKTFPTPYNGNLQKIDDGFGALDDKIGIVPFGETVEGQISLLNSNIAKHTAGTTIKCRRMGPVVSLTIGAAVTVGTDGVFYTIDEEFRPVENTYFFVTTSGQDAEQYLAVVKTNGDVAVYNRGNVLNYLFGNVTFIN